jgi:hypothetical protein
MLNGSEVLVARKPSRFHAGWWANASHGSPSMFGWRGAPQNHGDDPETIWVHGHNMGEHSLAGGKTYSFTA